MPLCLEKTIHSDKVENALKKIPAEDKVLEMADVFKALSDSSRLKMIIALSTDELCVCDLGAVCGLSDSAVSHQLRILRNLRLVRYRREGRIIYYRLDDDHVKTMIFQGLEHLSEARGTET